MYQYHRWTDKEDKELLRLVEQHPYSKAAWGTQERYWEYISSLLDFDVTAGALGSRYSKHFGRRLTPPYVNPSREQKGLWGRPAKESPVPVSVLDRAYKWAAGNDSDWIQYFDSGVNWLVCKIWQDHDSYELLVAEVKHTADAEIDGGPA